MSKHLSDLKSKALAVLRSLTTSMDERPPRAAGHHGLGDELSVIEDQLLAFWREGKFPSFAVGSAASTSKQALAQAKKRRDLVTLVNGLPPMNIEILELLGEQEEPETAFLYAYSRGSVAGSDSEAGKEFFERVERIIDEHPALSEAKEVDAILHQARRLYARLQASAYEKMD